MSNFMRITRNPATDQWEWATWIDNHFGQHNYGVKFPTSLVVLDARHYDFETSDKCCNKHDSPEFGECGLAGMGNRNDSFCCGLCPERKQ